MMEAEDTVMSLDAFNIWSKAWHLENDVPELYMKAEFLSRWELAKLQHQAEISFKAGIQAFIAHIMNDDLEYNYVGEGKKLFGEDIFWKFYEWTQKLGDVSKLQAIREVVEWMKQNHHYPQTKGGYYIETGMLEAKLKECGL